jgi:ferric-dicitrate binding protein FerR (iron transport regulator)
VELSGEAYFEVAQMAAVPFRVKAGNRTAVDVLGTSFNLSAYPDEPSINTTLLNGKVKVVAPGQPAALLLPGQQAKLNEQGVLQVLTNVDVAQVVAWKDGWFQFHNADLTEVLRELSRWYNVTFIYDGNIAPRAFEGRIQRDLALSKVLNALEKAQVHFRIEGNNVFVLP